MSHFKLLHALRRQNPDRMLQAFFECSADQSLMRSISHATFREILKLLRPANLIESYKTPHQDLSASAVNFLRLQPIEKIFENYFRTVRTVVDLRRQVGLRLTLADYTQLLDCARALGDGPAADSIWAELKLDGMHPDTTCYNHYMSAKCWSGLFQASLRQHTRLQAFQTRVRGTLSRRYQREHGNARGAALRAYEEMVSEGLFGDEKTFTLLMTAMARGGDCAGMKSVLKHVWNIDVDTVMELGDLEPEPVKHYAKDSPLRPTSDLLFTVAHSFGINSDIPTALRLVDYISRCYDIPIPIAVWEELFGWTYNLSVPRSGLSRKAFEPQERRLPITSVESLWRVMTGEPYNIAPTSSMYDRYIRNLFRRKRLGEALRRMEEGRILYWKSAQGFGRAKRELELATSIAERGIEIPITEVSIEHLQRKVEYARLVKLRDLMFTRRWIRKLLGSWRLVGGRLGDWERRALPQKLKHWTAVIPKMRYRSSGGLVQLRRL